MRQPVEPNTLTALVPALNEVANLESVVRIVESTAGACFDDYEVVIINDGSTDGTGAMADRLASANPRIRAIHHPKPRNLGGALKSGLAAARMTYVCVVHGNGGTPPDQLMKIWARHGEADLIIPYMLNAHERPLAAQLASRAFARLLNLLFGLRIRYYMHHVLYRHAQLAAVDIRTSSYAYQPEAIIKLVKGGCTYAEIGVADNFDKHGPTRSYALRNLAGVAGFLIRCMVDVYFRPHGKRVAR
ncbi:MAG: glycosyltransferase family 2 protein [Lentisphaerae bacterium]|nr:glycosyltransferase family 2 protein [Lentisphaerota bacterium]